MKTLIIIGLIVAGFIWVTWEIAHAPEGYEDEKGFHYGKEPEDKE